MKTASFFVCLLCILQTPVHALENISTANIYVKPGSVVDMSEDEVELYLFYGEASDLPSNPSAGAIGVITDSNGVDCSGGGSNQAVCIYNGTAWALSYAVVPSPPDVTIIKSTNCSAVTGAADGTVCLEYLP